MESMRFFIDKSEVVMILWIPWTHNFSINGSFIAVNFKKSEKLINQISWNENMDLQKMLKEGGISRFCDHDITDQMLARWLVMTDKKKIKPNKIR